MPLKPITTISVTATCISTPVLTTCIMNTVMHLPHFYCHHHFHNHCCQFIYCHYLFITCMLGVLCLAISRLHHIYTTFTPNLHQIYMAYTPSHTALYTAPGSAPTLPPHHPHHSHTAFTPPSYRLHTAPRPPSLITLTALLNRHHTAITPPLPRLTRLYITFTLSSHLLHTASHCLHSAPTALFHHFYTASTVPPTAYPHRLHTAPTPHSHRLSLALPTVLIIPQTTLTLHLCMLPPHHAHSVFSRTYTLLSHHNLVAFTLHSSPLHSHHTSAVFAPCLHCVYTTFTQHSPTNAKVSSTATMLGLSTHQLNPNTNTYAVCFTNVA